MNAKGRADRDEKRSHFGTICLILYAIVDAGRPPTPLVIGVISGADESKQRQSPAIWVGIENGYKCVAKNMWRSLVCLRRLELYPRPQGECLQNPGLYTLGRPTPP